MSNVVVTIGRIRVQRSQASKSVVMVDRGSFARDERGAIRDLIHKPPSFAALLIPRNAERGA